MALHSGARETARRLCRPWHPSMQPVAGYLALLDGDLDRAEEILAEEPVADPWLRGHATRIAALVALHRMELGRAEELLRAAVQEPAETGWQAQVHAELAHVLALRRAPGARVALERAEAATLRFGLGAVASVTRLHVALLAWEAGDASGAVSELEEAGALVEPGAAQHAAALLLAAAVLFGTQRPERAEALLGVLPALDPGWGDVFLVRALVEGLRTGAPSAQLGERVRGLPLVLRSTALPLLLRLCAERYPSGPAREACAEVADALWRQLEAARAR